MSFEPKLVTFGCRNCPDFLKNQDCISEGKYCLVPPIGHKDQISLYYNVKGSDHKVFDGNGDHNMNVAFLKESIRQRCIYDIANNNQNSDKIWLAYMYQFYLDCMMNGNKDIKACSDRIITHLDVNATMVEECYNHSFYDFEGEGTKSDNHMLQAYA